MLYVSLNSSAIISSHIPRLTSLGPLHLIQQKGEGLAVPVISESYPGGSCTTRSEGSGPGELAWSSGQARSQCWLGHRNDLEAGYMHLRRIKISPLDWKLGTLISTGRSTPWNRVHYKSQIPRTTGPKKQRISRGPGWNTSRTRSLEATPSSTSAQGACSVPSVQAEPRSTQLSLPACGKVRTYRRKAGRHTVAET